MGYICKPASPEIRVKKRATSVTLSCRQPGSNRYGYRYPRDFKSRASASSAMPAKALSLPD
nr:MAG TPA: hypothetical protein [Caudoviricetes sp.]